jgi:hypothetical protein
VAAAGDEEVWRVTDRLGHTVVLTQRRWAHILERRRFFRQLAGELRLTCSKSECITAEDNDVYYYRQVGKRYRRYKGQYILACAEDGSPRRVITAYLVDRFRKGEVVIWPETP